MKISKEVGGDETQWHLTGYMIINHDIYQESHLTFASGVWHQNLNSPLENKLHEYETDDNDIQNLHKYENLHHITVQVVNVVENTN